MTNLIIECKQFASGDWLPINHPPFDSKRRARYWLQDHRPARGKMDQYRITEKAA